MPTDNTTHKPATVDQHQLGLLLSFQAAYTAPAIMMSQNRQSELRGKPSLVT